MKKLIHSKFELDLSNFNLTETEENNWFSDSFFTKISFPFEIDLTRDLDIAFDFISLYSTSPETFFELKYQNDNAIYDATFEILEESNGKLQVNFEAGFESLPSWEKKLSELSLEKITLAPGTTIETHANSIINQTWPSVNYNFPMVHVDNIDTATDKWFAFEKIINNRKEGLFLENSTTIVSDTIATTSNRNIIQPLAYCLHILTQGFIDAGYILSGDILDDEDIKKATVYADVEYYSFNAMESVFETYIYYDNYVTTALWPVIAEGYVSYRTYLVENITVKGIGEFRITGNTRNFTATGYPFIFRIRFNGDVIYEFITSNPDDFGGDIFSFNVLFTTVTSVNTISIELATLIRTDIPDQAAILYQINPRHYYDGNNEPFTIIINEDKVDLTKAVPDMKFGDFVKIIKNWFNYDLSIKDNLAIMNSIENNVNHKDSINCEFLEIKYPTRKFNRGKSFLLSFTEYEAKGYNFLPVFQNKNEVLTSEFAENELTSKIEVNALPLPLFNRNNVTTAHAFEINSSKVYLVPYAGLTGGRNISLPIDNYLLPSVHLRKWKKWFEMRINSQNFKWSLIVASSKISALDIKQKFYAYKNCHILKSMTKTQVAPGIVEVEIETESIK